MQEMIGWQWHQLDHMQIICTSAGARQCTGERRKERIPGRRGDGPKQKVQNQDRDGKLL